MTRVDMACHQRQRVRSTTRWSTSSRICTPCCSTSGSPRPISVGHSMGGATTAGFAARHPEMVKAALICNIDGGQQPSDPVADKEAAETRRRGPGIRAGAWPGRLCPATDCRQDSAAFHSGEAEEEQLRFVTRYAHQPLHGYLSVGEALPWRDAWLTDGAQSLKMPVAILGGDRRRPASAAPKGARTQRAAAVAFRLHPR